MQKEETQGAVTTRSRPRLPQDYNVPTGDEGLVEWEWVVEQLERAKNYWISTARPDGKPHAVPVWAAWLDGTLYFDGHPQTRWGRNLQHNPSAVIHLESGNEVVILEGKVQDIAHLDHAIAEKVGEQFKAKYGYMPNTKEWEDRGLYAMRPQVVHAWTEFPRTMTRWQFPA
jgi:nitroimidazol reductase NimA-like FMN-containing flavoprotein (pyridoxamine 5'-phosphate oxidase superfamily)